MHRGEQNEKGVSMVKGEDKSISHPTDLSFTLILVKCGGTQVTPPLKQHRVADELEPGSEFQAGLLKHGLQLIGRHVAGIPHFIGAWLQVDIGLDEKNIVHCP